MHNRAYVKDCGLLRTKDPAISEDGTIHQARPSTGFSCDLVGPRTDYRGKPELLDGEQPLQNQELGLRPCSLGCGEGGLRYRAMALFEFREK